MYIALILVCSATLAVADCDSDNAIDVLAGLRAATPMDCFMNAQALIAQSGLVYERNQHFLKVVCKPGIVEYRGWR